MKILGIDPGIEIVGYALLATINKKAQVLASGSIQTSSQHTTQERLAEIYQDLKTILEEFKPDVASVEQLFIYKNQKTMANVYQARGIILLLLEQFKITTYEYTPLQVKQAITGYGKASKKEVKELVERELKTSLPNLDDTVDAIAIGLCCIQHNNF